MVSSFLPHVVLLVDGCKAPPSWLRRRSAATVTPTNPRRAPQMPPHPPPGPVVLAQPPTDASASPSVSNEHGFHAPGPVLLTPRSPHGRQVESLAFSQTRRKTQEFPLRSDHLKLASLSNNVPHKWPQLASRNISLTTASADHSGKPVFPLPRAAPW